MTDQKTGGMFSRLLNPETAKPKIDSEAHTTKKEAIVVPVESQTTQQTKTNGVTTPLSTKKSEKKEKKRKVGAYFTKSDRQILDDVEYKLNRGERVIGQSEILALGVETLGKVLDGKRTRLSSVEQIREYITSLLSKAREP
jgi:hypothetical protein